MRSDWNGGGGRQGGAGRSGGGSGGYGRGNGSGPRSGAGGGATPASGASREGRWSNELDSIFERAPKEVAAANKDDEKTFFEERSEVKPASLVCPNCNQQADYALTWLVRRKR